MPFRLNEKGSCYLHNSGHLLASKLEKKAAILLIFSVLIDVFPFVSDLGYFFMLPVLEFSSVIKMWVPLASTVVPILQGLALYLEEFCCVFDTYQSFKEQMYPLVFVQFAICVERKP